MYCIRIICYTSLNNYSINPCFASIYWQSIHCFSQYFPFRALSERTRQLTNNFQRNPKRNSTRCCYGSALIVLVRLLCACSDCKSARTSRGRAPHTRQTSNANHKPPLINQNVREQCVHPMFYENTCHRSRILQLFTLSFVLSVPCLLYCTIPPMFCTISFMSMCISLAVDKTEECGSEIDSKWFIMIVYQVFVNERNTFTN